VIRIPFHFTWGSCSIFGLACFTKPIIWIFHEINSLVVTELGWKLHGLKTKLYVNYLTMNKHIKVDCRIVKDKILLSIIKTSFLPIFLRATSLLAFGCFCFFKETILLIRSLIFLVVVDLPSIQKSVQHFLFLIIFFDLFPIAKGVKSFTNYILCILTLFCLHIIGKFPPTFLLSTRVKHDNEVIFC
jgi:hypothetical protein